jgi:5'-3' exonuclease
MKKPLNICFDFNNVALMTLFHPSVEAASGHMDIEHWHYLMFNQVHTFILETAIARKMPIRVFLANDTATDSWRHDVYPPYKANRVKDANIPWDTVYEQLDVFKETVKTYLPWHLVTVPGAEADDVIAIVTKRCERAQQQTVIYSTDADYLQLWSSNTRIYRPHISQYVDFPADIKVANAKVHCKTPEHFLEQGQCV